MKRIDVYYAYNVDINFYYVAKALGFDGFDYDLGDADFEVRLENDDNLSDLLEQFEYIKSSRFLALACPKTSFYKSHEFAILRYLGRHGYDGNDNLRSIEGIICSRVKAYVNGVLSEYGY
jgi:hypothetical protein